MNVRRLRITSFAIAIVLLPILHASAFAIDCPRNDPGGTDCARAAETAQNPLLVILGALIGAVLGCTARKAYAGPATPDWLRNWKLNEPNSFCKLGKLIAGQQGYTNARTPADKAQYVFERMKEMAASQHLKAASGLWPGDQADVNYYRPSGSLGSYGVVAAPMVEGGFFGFLGGAALAKFGVVTVAKTALLGGTGLGLAIGLGVGLYSLWNMAQPPTKAEQEADIDSVAPIKYGKIGNCGEWSQALIRTLICAGFSGSTVNSVAGDNSESGDFTLGHWGTNTAVMVGDLSNPSGGRIFDLYQAIQEQSALVTFSPGKWSNATVADWNNSFWMPKTYLRNGATKKVIATLQQVK